MGSWDGYTPKKGGGCGMVGENGRTEEDKERDGGLGREKGRGRGRGSC